MLVWQAYKAKVRSLAFSPDGRYIATTGGQSKFVSLWEAATGRLVRKLSNGYFATRLVSFHPDGQHIVGLFEAHGCCVWEIETGQPVAVLETNSWQYANTLAISPVDGRVVIHALEGFCEWRNSTRPCGQPRRCDRVLPLFSGIIYYPLQLTYSASGRYFCVIEQKVTLHDPNTYREVHALIDPLRARATAVAFTPDESRVAVAFGHRAAVWRMRRLEEPPVSLRGHLLMVRAVGFLPGGETVLTAGMDGTVRLWNANSGAEQRAFDWGIGKVRVAAIAPDGLTCAAGGESGQVVVWDVEE